MNCVVQAARLLVRPSRLHYNERNRFRAYLDWNAMRIVPLADAKARLSAYVDQCADDGPVIITRNGKTVAVLLAPVGEDDLDQLMLTRSKRFQALLNKSRGSIAAGKGLSRNDFWRTIRSRHTGKT
jgi:prevent-host-death family protein